VESLPAVDTNRPVLLLLPAGYIASAQSKEMFDAS
jgi:hypothetical protein